MATSTNYGWSEPDNTSLVKDGAQAIRTLGDAIDTSLWNSGYGQAGKNKIINGDFGIWQRGTTLSGGGYLADRFNCVTDATLTQSRQNFTAGSAPVAGYEAQYFIRYAKSAGGSFLSPYQAIEDVRTFAGQTITVSFWAKADAAVTIAPYYVQYFGSGGSSDVGNTIATQAITTSWVRYSFTLTLPSIAGKTIATGSYLQIFTGRYIGSAATTIDIWGVQVEYGSKATPFQTASGGSIQGELAMCQRYYFRLTAGTTNYNPLTHIGVASSSTDISLTLQPPTTMRTAPTINEYGSLSVYGGSTLGLGFLAVSTLTLIRATSGMLELSAAVTGAATGGVYRLQPNNAAGYIGIGAEL